MSRIVNATIGCDIEVFLMHKDTREVVSAEGYIDGTKHNPYNFDPSNPFFAVSLDNVAAEFCIPPVTDKEKFYEYIMKALGYLNQKVPEYLCTAPIPAAILDEKYLMTENAQTFGCDPDLCVWTKSINPKPEAPNKNLRSCGGHIHVGYENPDMEINELIIKAMDLHIGVPSVLQEPDNDRKLLYGKAGCFRVKDYGVEYRTVSNYYAGDKRMTDWVFEATQRAIEAVNDDFPFDDYHEEIVTAINNNDKVVAGNLIRSLDLQLA